MEDLEFFEFKKIDKEQIRKYVLNALFGEFATNKSLFNKIMGTVGKPIVFKEETNETLKNHWFYKYIYSDYFRAELFYKKEKGRYFLCKRELIGSIIMTIHINLEYYKGMKERRFYTSEHKNIKKEIQKDIKIIEDFRDLFFNKLKLENEDKEVVIYYTDGTSSTKEPYAYKNINNLFDALITRLSNLDGNKKNPRFTDYIFNFHNVYYAQTISSLKREINRMVCSQYSLKDNETLDFTYEIGLLIEFLQENKII